MKVAPIPQTAFETRQAWQSAKSNERDSIRQTWISISEAELARATTLDQAQAAYRNAPGLSTVRDRAFDLCVRLSNIEIDAADTFETVETAWTRALPHSSAKAHAYARWLEFCTTPAQAKRICDIAYSLTAYSKLCQLLCKRIEASSTLDDARLILDEAESYHSSYRINDFAFIKWHELLLAQLEPMTIEEKVATLNRLAADTPDTSSTKKSLMREIASLSRHTK